MTEPMNCPHAAGRRRCAGFALIVFVLLSASCENQVARQDAPSRFVSNQVARQDAPSGLASNTLAANDLPSRLMSRLEPPAAVMRESSGDSEIPFPRKIVRTGSLQLLVSDVAQSITKIGSIVSGAGGYVEKATHTNSGGPAADMTVRVPSASLDNVIADIKRLATTVDRESVEVRDVTREYIDLDARLRNSQAEEAQYLQILKRATTIKDTLDVTEKLSDVRGRVEQMQGEMKFLTTQIDLSSLEISLGADSAATVAGIHWRPLRQAHVAVEEMISGLADWADSVLAFLINLPVIAVWLVSVVLLALVAVRILGFLWRKFGAKTGWRIPWGHSPARDDAPAS